MRDSPGLTDISSVAQKPGENLSVRKAGIGARGGLPTDGHGD
jgi:hypothetical protein